MNKVESVSSNKGNSWCFTLNNYSEKDVEFFKNLMCNYIVFGKEVGKEGTPHLQGFIIFKSQYRLAGLKKIHNETHWELSKSEYLDHNYNYVTKDGAIFFMDYRSQGKRNDIVALTNLCKDGGIKKVIDEMPEMYIKFHSGIEKLCHRLSKERDRNEPPIVEWIYGSTGKGKTKYVYDNHTDIWPSGKNLQWWDGYENQEVVLIDDFRRDFCTFHELLRILDRYPYQVAVKGGFRKLNSKYIYITSPFSPIETYETREDIQQLLRRITKITKL